MTIRTLAVTLAVAATAHAGGLTARTVTYNPEEIVPVATKLRHVTLIVLPEGEQILDFLIGDKDQWSLEGAERFAYLKPGKAGAETSVTLVTASGNIYSFLAREGGGDPDLKLLINAVLHRNGPRQGARPGARFAPAAEVERLRQELEQQKARAAARDQASGVDYFRRASFDYDFKANAKPFYVEQIWRDERATYLRCRASEKPALYELQDGRPVLINYELVGDTYMVPKVVDSGYLAIGKKTFVFRRRSQ